MEDIEVLYWNLYEELFEEKPFCEMLAKVFNKANETNKVTEKPAVFGEFLLEKVISPAGRLPYPELFTEFLNIEHSI